MNTPPTEIWVVVCQNDRAHPRWGVDEGGPIVYETYVRKATRENAMKHAASMETCGACRIGRIVFDDATESAETTKGQQ